MLNEIVAISECDDCGYGIICNPTFVSIMNFLETYMISTICQFCARPITCEISESELKEFTDAGIEVH